MDETKHRQLAFQGWLQAVQARSPGMVIDRRILPLLREAFMAGVDIPPPPAEHNSEDQWPWCNRRS